MSACTESESLEHIAPSLPPVAQHILPDSHSLRPRTRLNLVWKNRKTFSTARRSSLGNLHCIEVQRRGPSGKESEQRIRAHLGNPSCGSARCCELGCCALGCHVPSKPRPWRFKAKMSIVWGRHQIQDACLHLATCNRPHLRPPSEASNMSSGFGAPLQVPYSYEEQ